MMGLRIGVMLPASATDEPRAIGSLARHAEDVGLDGVFVGDHLAGAVPILDSTVALTTAAEATKRVDIGFAVMTLALRHVAWAAKQVASMQHASGDRVILGVGAGAEHHGRSAWAAVGVPYDDRGRRTEEALAILPGLIQGKATRLGDAEIALEPPAAVPPIWIGGTSRAAMRRSVDYGDAWFPSMRSPSAIASTIGTLEELAAERGRPTPSIVLGGYAALGHEVPRTEIDAVVRSLAAYGISADQAAQIPITGGTSSTAQRFAEYGAVGVSYLVLGLHPGNWRRQCDLVAAARALMR